MSNELSVIDSTLAGIRGEMADTIKQYNWSILPDSQLHAAKQALTKNNFISKIAAQNPGAVHAALVQSSTLGIDLTEGKRQGWLVPRKNQNGQMVVQLQVGYKGVEAIHQKMGVIERLVITIVRKNDDFEWSGDDQEKPSHKANWLANEQDRGEIAGVYSITYFPGGDIQVMVKPVSEIYEKHRDISDSWKSYKRDVDAGKKAYPPPWASFEAAMVEKTMAYIASKQWPAVNKNGDVAEGIAETLHSIDTSDYTEAFATYTAEQKACYLSLIKAEDALGFYLLNKSAPIEVITALDRSYMKGIPRGKKGVPGKMEARKALEEMVNTGEDIFLQCIAAIQSDDKFAFMELAEECTDYGKKFLMRNISDIQRDIADEWLNEA